MAPNKPCLLGFRDRKRFVLAFEKSYEKLLILDLRLKYDMQVCGYFSTKLSLKKKMDCPIFLYLRGRSPSVNNLPKLKMEK